MKIIGTRHDEAIKGKQIILFIKTVTTDIKSSTLIRHRQTTYNSEKNQLHPFSSFITLILSTDKSYRTLKKIKITRGPYLQNTLTNQIERCKMKCFKLQSISLVYFKRARHFQNTVSDKKRKWKVNQIGRKTKTFKYQFDAGKLNSFTKIKNGAIAYALKKNGIHTTTSECRDQCVHPFDIII